MKVTIVGTGYVGLVTGTCLAEMGHDVVCVDVNESKIERLKRGEIPIYEPGLSELVMRNSKEGRLQFTTDIREGIESSEVVFNAVGTPPGENHEADLKYVKQVARDFGTFLNGYKVFVIKSTVPVGTSGEVKAEIDAVLAKRSDALGVSCDVVSNPEFLREGTAVKDFMGPDRIVVGIDQSVGTPERAEKIMRKLYDPFVRVGRALLFTDIRSAEIIKYASNAFLATKISFINEIANFCDIAGGDVKQVAKGMGLDERIGSRFLHAGLGYGGSCFPKDVKALIQTGKKSGALFSILRAVEDVNARQRERMVDKIRGAVGELSGKTIAVWGLAFKPRTDDMREAPSLDVIAALQKAGAMVRAFDPVARGQAELMLGSTGLLFCEDPYLACEGADALAIMTEWDEFRAMDFGRLRSLMKAAVLIDGRNMYERHDIEEAGFTYVCFGR